MNLTALESLARFKRATEEKWQSISLRRDLWGFQFQRGTRWNRGLLEDEIKQYESVVEASFPLDFRAFLRVMNGTDIPCIDVRGSGGEEVRFGPGFYSFPRDIELIQKLIQFIHKDVAQLSETLREENYELSTDAKLIPLFAHRYIVCTSDPKQSVVLSIWDSLDAIVYGENLEDYLQRELLLENTFM